MPFRERSTHVSGYPFISSGTTQVRNRESRDLVPRSCDTPLAREIPHGSPRDLAAPGKPG